MNPYEEAIKIWISRNHVGRKVAWAEDIEDFLFDKDGFGCETCWTEEVVIRYTVNRNGKKTYHCITIDDMSPVKFIQECMEIYNTICHIKPLHEQMAKS